MEKFAILQSGFVTNILSKIERSEDTSIDFKNFILNKAYYRDTNEFFYFPIVNNLYKEYNTNINIINDIDFREKIIKVAFQVFGNKNLSEWVTMQNDFGLLTQLHKQFLVDTFEYIYELNIRNERSMPITQWCTLLVVGGRNNEISLKNMFGENNKFIDTPMTQTLSTWLSLPNGFEDLLITLYVLFGNRTTTSIY